MCPLSVHHAQRPPALRPRRVHLRRHLPDGVRKRLQLHIQPPPHGKLLQQPLLGPRADREPGAAAELADFVGSRLAVNPWTKQRLLEELSVRQRLDMELETLSDAIREMAPKVDAARAQRWWALGVMN